MFLKFVDEKGNFGIGHNKVCLHENLCFVSCDDPFKQRILKKLKLKFKATWELKQ